MKLLRSIFAIETVLIVCVIASIFLFVAITINSVKATYGYIHTLNATHIEGSIKSLSKDHIELNDSNKRFTIENGCNCKLTQQRIAKAKHAFLMYIDNDNEIVTLKLDDEYIFDEIAKYKKQFSTTIWLLLTLAIIAAIYFLALKIFNKKSAIERIKLEKLAEELAPKVNHLREPALRLVKTQSKKLSKFGGKPHVEENSFIWPINNGEPMAFLAQISLAELTEQYCFEWLPKEGLMLFFYDLHSMPWGFEPSHKSGWKVIYYLNPTHPAEFPDNIHKDAIIPEFSISPQCVGLLPPWDSIDYKSIGLNEDDFDAYIELQCKPEENELHQVGGFATSVQDDGMQEQAQFTSHGISTGNVVNTRDPKVIALQSGISNWKLLFQMDSDHELNLMWGDLGMIYFWIEEEKAKQGNFEDAWLILQCH